MNRETAATQTEMRLYEETDYHYRTHSYDDGELSPIHIDEYFDRLFADIEQAGDRHYYQTNAQVEANHQAEECRHDDDYQIASWSTKSIPPQCPLGSVSSDFDFEDYESPDDIKTRGGVNYHNNKQKATTSPKSERRKLREKRTKDLPAKDSRCHRKMVETD